MHILIPLLILILYLMELINGQYYYSRHLRHRRGSAGRLCQAGCLTCSAFNGCLSCKPRLFFHLQRDAMRERGMCVASCPRGHFGTRSPHLNTCTKCREECVSCFNRSFCTHCHQGHYLYRGRCEDHCPEGLIPNAALRECTECPADCDGCLRNSTCARCKAGLYLLHGQCHRTCPEGFEHEGQLMKCTPQVNCEVGRWRDWGPCTGTGETRSSRRGKERRVREVLRPASPDGEPCPHTTEGRKCVIKRRPRSPS